MDSHSFEEHIGSIFYCDSLIAGYENGHLEKLSNHQKYAIISFLFAQKAIHVIHRDGLPRPLKSRKMGV
jgi:hypothetical protein